MSIKFVSRTGLQSPLFRDPIQSYSPSFNRIANIFPAGDMKMDKKPIARCEANGVDAYEYPFYVKPAQGMEPAYMFLEDHVYNFNSEETEEIMVHLISIEQEEDLQKLGYEKDVDGIYILSQLEKPWLHGGES
jgi:hypothetical protein